MDNFTNRVTIKTKKFTINGKEYPDLQSVPPHLQKFVADQNQNGMPDLFEKYIDPNNPQKIKHQQIITDIQGLPSPLSNILKFLIKVNFPEEKPSTSHIANQPDTPNRVDSSQFEAAKKYIIFFLIGAVFFYFVNYFFSTSL